MAGRHTSPPRSSPPTAPSSAPSVTLDHRFRLASLTKPIADVGDARRRRGGHRRPRRRRRPARAARCATCSPTPAATRSTGPSRSPRPSAARIYSNTGIELAAAAHRRRRRHRRSPTTSPRPCSRRSAWRGAALEGSPAHAAWATRRRRRRVPRRGRMRPTLARRRPPPPMPSGSSGRTSPVSSRAWAASIRARGAWGSRSGGVKRPHWTGRANSAATYGHFGGAGTMMWADPHAGCALVALTDRGFDDWSLDAMRLWPEGDALGDLDPAHRHASGRLSHSDAGGADQLRARYRRKRDQAVQPRHRPRGR